MDINCFRRKRLFGWLVKKMFFGDSFSAPQSCLDPVLRPLLGSAKQTYKKVLKMARSCLSAVTLFYFVTLWNTMSNCIHGDFHLQCIHHHKLDLGDSCKTQNEQFSMFFSKPTIKTNNFLCVFQSQQSKRTIFNIFFKVNNRNENFSMLFFSENLQNNLFLIFFKLTEHYCNCSRQK